MAAVLLALGLAWPGPARAQEIRWSSGQAIYIPAYAYLKIQGKRQTVLPLSTTLFVHNTSQETGLTITSIKHYDGKGVLIKEYAPEPVKLAPLAALDLLVEEPKENRGSGTCFVVTWMAEKPISPPLAESVMIGTAGQQGISYSSVGRVIRELE